MLWVIIGYRKQESNDTESAMILFLFMFHSINKNLPWSLYITLPDSLWHFGLRARDPFIKNNCDFIVYYIPTGSVAFCSSLESDAFARAKRIRVHWYVLLHTFHCRFLFVNLMCVLVDCFYHYKMLNSNGIQKRRDDACSVYPFLISHLILAFNWFHWSFFWIGFDIDIWHCKWNSDDHFVDFVIQTRVYCVRGPNTYYILLNSVISFQMTQNLLLLRF